MRLFTKASVIFVLIALSINLFKFCKALETQKQQGEITREYIQYTQQYPNKGQKYGYLTLNHSDRGNSTSAHPISQQNLSSQHEGHIKNKIVSSDTQNLNARQLQYVASNSSKEAGTKNGKNSTQEVQKQNVTLGLQDQNQTTNSSNMVEGNAMQLHHQQNVFYGTLSLQQDDNYFSYNIWVFECVMIIGAMLTIFVVNRRKSL